MDEKKTQKTRKNEMAAIEGIFSANFSSGRKIFSFLKPSSTVSIIKSVSSVCQSMLPRRLSCGFVMKREASAASSDTASIGSRLRYAMPFFIEAPSG